ncbi:hypothetical protein BDV29DRAFT_184889 [Aspergillus leporis]|jgi:hypothetical protein|uniref:Retrovirus-related Pol polyprotein from transposon TNT 1-94-like beta-barrel domain-containing protein n=1 Tax=Aspergillus leporis TaxID=41062 RepID=A0A5N5WLR8_9EURO|nr:hypothetical protein BDV29DRAFT_184889 [Aspergillus leporis]
MGEIGEFWRDVKEDRKRGKLENRPHRRCWDWMIVSGHCHYARNRSSFVTYRRVGRHISDSMMGGSKTFVAGVGTVELKVRPSKKQGLPTRTLVLDNVLHIPSAISNGFCWAIYHFAHGGEMACSREGFSATDGQNHPLWCGQPFCGLQKLVLAGNPQGESYLEDGKAYALSMYIDEEELEKVLHPSVTS